MRDAEASGAGAVHEDALVRQLLAYHVSEAKGQRRTLDEDSRCDRRQRDRSSALCPRQLASQTLCTARMSSLKIETSA